MTKTWSNLVGQIHQHVHVKIKTSLFLWAGKFVFHHFFHSASGCFRPCGVASTHSATQEVSSTALPFSLLLLPLLLLNLLIFLSQPPPRSPMVETINRAAFHAAVWRGYHLHSLPSSFPTHSISPSLPPFLCLPSLTLIPPASAFVHSKQPNIAWVTAL